MSTKRLATDAMFLTLALVVSYIEVLIPVPVGIPGVKLGLANGVIMVLLFFTTWTRTLEISVIRVVLAGYPMTIAYSLAGGILSLVIMGLLKKIDGFSPIGISVGGGVAHNIGQLSVAVFLMENTKIYYYAPVLLITGTIAGIIIGVLSGVLVKKIPPQLFR
jgi:heptaprenyl diphosphate synthase